MLKSSRKPYTKEQFVKLRAARVLIEEEFNSEFSLQVDDVVNEVYEYAVRSESNELFRLFSALNSISDEPVGNPLNEEQLVLLRQAKGLIREEFDEEFVLSSANVMDLLHGFATRSSTEALLDIYFYLSSRPDHLPIENSPVVNEQEVSATADAPADSALIFKELSAPDFERLRQAKQDIRTEFDNDFSLHTRTALDQLYDYAVRSEETVLFELFCDLQRPQTLQREGLPLQHDWLTKEQFFLLCEARASVKREFGAAFDFRSNSLLADVYQFALRSEEEDLFNLCWEFQQLCEPGRQTKLPSKEEFRLLRQARTLVQEEFDTELQLQSEAIEYDLYQFAVRSEMDELFDLHSQLMALPERITPTSPVADREDLSKDEFVILRGARRMVREEFDEYLALEEAGVLDRLYGFALESAGEELFDLHAQLHAGAAVLEDQTSEDEQTMTVVGAESPAPRQVTAATAASEERPDENPAPQHQDVENIGSASSAEDKTAGRRAPGLLKRIFGGSEVETENSAIVPDDIPTLEEVAPAKRNSEGATEPVTAKTESSGTNHQENRQAASDGPVSAEESAAKPAAGPLEQGDFGDRLVKAMQKERTSPGVKKTAQAGPQPAPKTSAKAVVRDVELDGKSLPEPRFLGDADVTWYISSDQQRMRIRLVGPLDVAEDGELLLVKGPDDVVGATLDLEEETPVILAAADTITVNGEAVDGKHKLEAGDKIKIADELLMVESVAATGGQAADGAL
ncbi:MAG: hypothetical protein RJQ07_11865 [Pseudomonadales bacterium]